MTTINISLPEKLKQKAQSLVDEGYYASFSDLIRDSLRKTVSLFYQKSKHELLAEDAWLEHKQGKTITLNSKEDVDRFFESLNL